MKPKEDIYYYRFLLKLSLDPEPNWWAKFYREAESHLSGRAASSREASPTRHTHNASHARGGAFASTSGRGDEGAWAGAFSPSSPSAAALRAIEAARAARSAVMLNQGPSSSQYQRRRSGGSDSGDDVEAFADFQRAAKTFRNWRSQAHAIRESR